MSRGSPARAIAWMALASVFFALMTLSARRGNDHLPWIEVAAARGAFGWVIAVGVARARGASLAVKNVRVAWMRTLLGTASLLSTFYLYGQPALPLGDIVAIGALSPVFIALLAPRLLGEATSRRTWVATPIAFAGVLLLVRPHFELAGHLAGIALLSALLSALAMMALRKLGSDETPEAIAAHFAGRSALVCTLLALPTAAWPTPEGAAWLVATGVLGGLGQLSMTRAYALDAAARVGTIGYLGTVLTQVLAVVVLHEATSPLQVAGSAMVLAAGLVLTVGAVRARAVYPPPSATPPR